MQAVGWQAMGGWGGNRTEPRSPSVGHPTTLQPPSGNTDSSPNQTKFKPIKNIS